MLACNPYRIEGPAVICDSGGRTSGYMLRHILDAHDGKLPDDVLVSFQNTGKEMPETLDFIQECSERWNVPIVWLEWRHDGERPGFGVVNHNSASRNGEPFKALIDRREYLPNPVTRFCTFELKVKTLGRWLRREVGWKNWDAIVGIRADEPRRAARTRRHNEAGKDIFDILTPLVDAGVTRRDVMAWWEKQPFDLRLPNANGVTPTGNCDLCFLKSMPTIAGIMRDRPDLVDWWVEVEAEAEARASKPSGATFRADRPKYADLLRMVRDQGDLFADLPDDGGLPCMCTD